MKKFEDTIDKCAFHDIIKVPEKVGRGTAGQKHARHRKYHLQYRKDAITVRENDSPKTDKLPVEEKKAAKNAKEAEVKRLLALIKEGDSEAFSTLCGIYAPLIEGMTRRFAPSMGITETTIGTGGLGMEELRQDASMSLYKAALRYDPDDEQKGKAVSFGLYAKICIRNALISVFRRAKREERKWEREQKTSEKEDTSDKTLPEEAIEPFAEVLSPFEYTVFALYITGKPPREISAEVGKSEKSVSNAIYRSKTKIKGMLAKKKETRR